MTTSHRHSRAPLRRSSTPEKILSAGLATATCVGIVGLVGARSIQANAAASETQSTVDSTTVEPVALVATEPTTASGLTEADLDAYAAQLVAEKNRLDAYRAKLVKTAHRLQRVAAENAKAAAAASVQTSTTQRPASTPAAPPKQVSVAKPVARPVSKPVSKPVAKPAPKPAAAPKPAPAPKPQAHTKSS